MTPRTRIHGVRPAIAGPAILVLLAAAGCGTGSTVQPPNREWSLVKMELDPAAVKNAGMQPLFRRPTGGEFGLIPRGVGTIRITDTGTVAVQIEIHEPIMNYRGQSDVDVHQIMKFFGVQSPDGSKFILPDAEASTQPLGVATVIHVQDQSGDRLRIQAATGDRLLPYVCYFDPLPARPAYVNVPFLP